MEATPALHVREQLTDRRTKLAAVLTSAPDRSGLQRLLDEVDAALSRLDAGTFGVCENCLESIEAERLLADPLVRFCLDHLPPDEQRALERDLELAARIQRGLLPDPQLATPGWRFAYHYEPARLVSGDYCDLIPADGGSLYFLLGDVSGKGVGASMLMAHLHAMMRTLVSIGMPLAVLMERASRLFCESTLPTQYATLVCGCALPDGTVEVCVAGHVPPIVAAADGVRLLGAAGLPIGMFCSEQFTVEQLRLAPGDTLMIVTDGVSEAEDTAGVEYGIDRLAAFVHQRRELPTRKLVDACVRELDTHGASRRRADDATVLVLQRDQL
jgi:sigma-B regulation protein RsbU (phosphoserine phosphatase)